MNPSTDPSEQPREEPREAPSREPRTQPSNPHAAIDWQATMAAGEFEGALAQLRALELVDRGDAAMRRRLEAIVTLRTQLRDRNYRAAVSTLGTLDGMDLQTLGIEATDLTPSLAALEGGERALKERNRELAREHFEAARVHALTRSEAENQLGVLMATDGENAAARAHFEAALESDKRNHRALTNLGNIELERGDLMGAERLYREAIKLAPQYATAHHNLAAALRKQGKRAESVIELKRAARLSVNQGTGTGTGPGPIRGLGKVFGPGRAPSVGWIFLAIAVVLVLLRVFRVL